MIKIRNLRKEYKANKQTTIALSDISIDLPSTGFIGIVGESGSGKTTLLNCIGGLDKAKGRIHVEGKIINAHTNEFDRYRSKNIGYVFQDYCLLEECSVKENLQIAINIAKTSDTNDDSRIDAVLKLLGILKYKKRNVNTLSGGQKQRVAIARALVNQPKVILADEPTAHLDEANRQLVLSILKQLSKYVLILFVSHEMNDVYQFCDRIIELRRGKIKSDTLNAKADAVNTDAGLASTQVDNASKQKLSNYKKEVIRIGNNEMELWISNYSSNSIKLVLASDQVIIFEKTSHVQIVGQDYFQETIDVSENSKELSVVGENHPLANDFFRIEVKRSNKSRKKYRAKKNLRVSRKRAFMLIGTVIASIFLAFSMFFFDYRMQIDDKDFIRFHKNTIQIDTLTTLTQDQQHFLTQLKGIVLSPFAEQQALELRSDTSYQNSPQHEYDLSFNSCLLTADMAKELLCGRYPENSFEIIIDELITEELFRSDSNSNYILKSWGYREKENFLGDKIKLNDEMELTIVGITSENCPAVYLQKESLLPFAWQKRASDNIAIYTDVSLLGKNELKENEIYMDEETFNGNEEYRTTKKIKINANTYQIAGTYHIENFHGIFMNEQAFGSLYWDNYFANSLSIHLIAEDVSVTSQLLEEKGYISSVLYDSYKAIYLNEIANSRLIRIVLIVGILCVVSLLYYISEKGRVLQKKEEILMKRLLGETRGKIMSSMIVKSILIMAVLALPSYLISFLGLQSVISVIGAAISISSVPWDNIFIGMALLMLIASIVTTIVIVPILRSPVAKLIKLEKS